MTRQHFQMLSILQQISIKNVLIEFNKLLNSFNSIVDQHIQKKGKYIAIYTVLSILQQISVTQYSTYLTLVFGTFNSIVDQQQQPQRTGRFQNQLYFQFYSRLAERGGSINRIRRTDFQFYSRLAIHYDNGYTVRIKVDFQFYSRLASSQGI